MKKQNDEDISLTDYRVYSDEFYRANASCVSYSIFFVDIINNLLHPKSVIDIGCGVGGALSIFKNKYNCEIQGLDGDYVNRKYLLISDNEFTSFNLEERLPINTSLLKKERYDLAISTEVAEHLLPSRAMSFVEDLTKLSDCVLFSAAVPMQGGDNHINERPLEYWVNLFEKYNYTPISCIRTLFKNCMTYDDLKENGCEILHYANNLVLFIKTSALNNYNIDRKKYEDNWQNIPLMQQHLFNKMFKNMITTASLDKNKSKIRCLILSIVRKLLNK